MCSLEAQTWPGSERRPRRWAGRCRVSPPPAPGPSPLPCSSLVSLASVRGCLSTRHTTVSKAGPAWGLRRADHPSQAAVEVALLLFLSEENGAHVLKSHADRQPAARSEVSLAHSHACLFVCGRPGAADGKHSEHSRPCGPLLRRWCASCVCVSSQLVGLAGGSAHRKAHSFLKHR